MFTKKNVLGVISDVKMVIIVGNRGNRGIKVYRYQSQSHRDRGSINKCQFRAKNQLRSYQEKSLEQRA